MIATPTPNFEITVDVTSLSPKERERVYHQFCELGLSWIGAQDTTYHFSGLTTPETTKFTNRNVHGNVVAYLIHTKRLEPTHTVAELEKMVTDRSKALAVHEHIADCGFEFSDLQDAIYQTHSMLTCEDNTELTTSHLRIHFERLLGEQLTRLGVGFE